MTSVVSAQPLDDRAEIGILTVISVELEAALKAFPPLKRTKDPRSGTIFRTGTIHSELTNHDYRVVLVCIDEPGNPAAAAAATELLLKYDPRAVLLMGIAGGMRDKLKIGDVAFSERVVAYGSAALTKATDGTTRVERRPDIDRTPHRMMQDVADYLARPDPQRLTALFRKMDGQFPTPPPGKEEEYAKHVASAVRAKLGTIGAGEKLMRNPDEIKALNRDVHSKLQVVAMEEVGLVNAARRLDAPWLVIRGISDFGDEFKNDDFHVFASKAAAAVLVDFLVHGIDVGPPEPPPGWKAAETVTEQWKEETRDVIGDGVRIIQAHLDN